MIATRINVTDPYRTRSISSAHRSTIPLRNDGQGCDEVTYNIAASLTEREAAYRLVHESYVHSGLIDENPHGMRVTPYHLLPTTDVFTATYRGEVIYTVTLISDDELGLPLEELYATEIDELRQQGLYLSEVSCLASREGVLSQTEMFDVFVNLMSLMAQYARHNELDRFLIAVHPRHMRLYQRTLGFQQIGPERMYASVRYSPAVAASHDFEALDRKRYRLYDQIYRNRFRKSELLRQPMPFEERQYFEAAADAFKGGPQVLTAAA